MAASRQIAAIITIGALAAGCGASPAEQVKAAAARATCDPVLATAVGQAQRIDAEAVNGPERPRVIVAQIHRFLHEWPRGAATCPGGSSKPSAALDHWISVLRDDLVAL